MAEKFEHSHGWVMVLDARSTNRINRSNRHTASNGINGDFEARRRTFPWRQLKGETRTWRFNESVSIRLSISAYFFCDHETFSLARLVACSLQLISNYIQNESKWNFIIPTICQWYPNSVPIKSIKTNVFRFSIQRTYRSKSMLCGFASCFFHFFRLSSAPQSS